MDDKEMRHEYDWVLGTNSTSGGTEADYLLVGRFLFTRTRSLVACRPPDGRRDAAGAWHHESDANGRERCHPHDRSIRDGRDGPTRNRASDGRRLRHLLFGN